MQRVQAFEPKAKASIDLESFVTEDHLRRRINRILDLSFIRELTAPCYAAEKGRPSIDPGDVRHIRLHERLGEINAQASMPPRSRQPAAAGCGRRISDI